jgi:4-aminobutyrate aminotransferase
MAQAIDDLSHISPVWSRVTSLVIERGQGCYVYTQDGQPYLDFTSGIGVTNTGHSHPRVVQAVQQQAARIMHAQVNCYYHTPLIRLSALLSEVTPAHLDTFFFANSGAEATEGAVKLARHITRRPNVIVFQGSFHGRTAQTMAMTTSKTTYRVDYQPLPGGVFVAPFPYAYRHQMSESRVSQWALAELEHLLHSQTAPQETAAVVIEPVLGEGGYVPAPVEYLQGLRGLCDRHGILLVMDEVQTGFGRTGRMFCHEYASIQPDIMIMAKGLGSGFPISAIAAPAELMSRWQVGTHGGTYGGNPMGCAAAEATIHVLRDEKLVENAAARGDQLRAGLRAIQQKYPALGDVRGPGLMIGCEFSDPATRQPDAAIVKRIVSHALTDGRLILLTCGTYSNIIRWIPPLVVSETQISDALAIFEQAVAASV